MNQTSGQIDLQEIEKLIQKSGRGFAAWYVGAAADAQKRLFDDHQVNKANGQWIYRTLGTSAKVRRIQQALFKAGCKGGPSGDEAPDKKDVYAYMITATTVQEQTKPR